MRRFVSYTPVNSRIGFWLHWHPSLFIRLVKARFLTWPASAPACGLMKILGASFTKFPILAFTWVYLLFFPFVPFTIGFSIEERPMVVVIPSYNNIEWYDLNLSSVLSQEYKHFRVLYVDDHSTDGTGEAVDTFVAQNDPDQKVKVIHNGRRIGALGNICYAVHSCDPDEIVVLVDGDDWLLHRQVLAQLNEVYDSGEIWFTHGSLMEWPWGNVTWNEPIPDDVMATRTYRTCKCPSHLRTFYAWLFQRIRIEDFQYHGEFFQMAWDMAIMYPLVEMAGGRHAFISEANYAYNMMNPINDNKVNRELQNRLDQWIRHLPPYSELVHAKDWPSVLRRQRAK